MILESLTLSGNTAFTAVSYVATRAIPDEDVEMPNGITYKASGVNLFPWLPIWEKDQHTNYWLFHKTEKKTFSNQKVKLPWEDSYKVYASAENVIAVLDHDDVTEIKKLGKFIHHCVLVASPSRKGPLLVAMALAMMKPWLDTFISQDRSTRSYWSRAWCQAELKAAKQVTYVGISPNKDEIITGFSWEKTSDIVNDLNALFKLLASIKTERQTYRQYFGFLKTLLKFTETYLCAHEVCCIRKEFVSQVKLTSPYRLSSFKSAMNAPTMFGNSPQALRTSLLAYSSVMKANSLMGTNDLEENLTRYGLQGSEFGALLELAKPTLKKSLIRHSSCWAGHWEPSPVVDSNGMLAFASYGVDRQHSVSNLAYGLPYACPGDIQPYNPSNCHLTSTVYADTICVNGMVDVICPPGIFARISHQLHSFVFMSEGLVCLAGDVRFDNTEQPADVDVNCLLIAVTSTGNYKPCHGTIAWLKWLERHQVE